MEEDLYSDSSVGYELCGWLSDNESKYDEEDLTGNLTIVSDSNKSNSYIDKLANESGLYINRPLEIQNAYNTSKEAGLFTLFFSKSFKSMIIQWTNSQLVEKNNIEMSFSEFDAFLGLEIAMSINPFNDITEYWNLKRFMGQDEFPYTMGRNRFQTIRGNLQLHHLEKDYNFDKRDPLWHSRFILSHFQKRFTEIAVPYGVTSFDESSVRTKAKSRAKSYMPSKPDKYAVRFYTSVGWKSLYVHSIWDSGSGNSTEISSAINYTRLFPLLETPMNIAVSRSNINMNDATALWAAMLSHQTKSYQSPTEHRVVVCDNFYTRHSFAKLLKLLTDGEIRILGTMRFNYVDKWSKSIIKESIKRVSNADRGTWELITAVDVTPEYEQSYETYQRQINRLPIAHRSPFPLEPPLSENAGYIIFKDKKTVIFYTNDLAKTPSSRVLSGDNAEAQVCCQGLVPIKRWTGDEIMHRKKFMVPAIVAAYNKYMNAVDRIDQIRSTNPIRRKEMRLSMSIFTWLIDLAIINSFSLLQEIDPDNGASMREFKRRIAESLTESEYKSRRTTLQIGKSVEPKHFLTRNSTKYGSGRLSCYLCHLVGKTNKKSLYGCTSCLRGYHPECFTAYHYQDAFTSCSKSVQAALDANVALATRTPVYKTRLRKNTSITQITDLELPN